ncbi:hypothetical protein SAMD00023353_3001100 [Rosellinia necatrix]|uniref:Uncharacterized protein n=1 Tax=Rosellinia necatrix TaxID=77044 RepID=A0A1W2TJD6_ROSNE|nr:hypothetical protein SAMD00023353_3001100 [Rosellinia necatrix]
MESGSGLRRSTRGSIRPPADRDLRASSEANSSDEDDGDIPANKIPTVSPSKPPFFTRTHIDRAKRPHSDIAQGGIVLYAGSKKPRNGYNMAPIAREPPPSLRPDFLCGNMSIEQTPSRAESIISIDSEDNVSDALVSRVNDAFRRRDAHQTQGQAEAPAANSSNEIKLEELGGDETRADDQDLHLPLLDPNSFNITYKNTEELFRDNRDGTLPTAVALDKENREELGIRMRANPVSLPAGGDLNLAKSPTQLNELEDDRNATPHSIQEVPARKRGRPPKVRRVSDIPNSTLDTGKKKPGRPRKSYPRLRDEPHEDYATHPAKLHDKTISRVPDSDSQPLRQLSLLPNGTSLVQPITTNESIDGPREAGQDNGLHASVHLSGATHGQKSDISQQSYCPTCPDPNNSPLAPEPNIQPTPKQQEGALRSTNVAVYCTRDGLDRQNGGLGRDQKLAHLEALERHDNECADSDAENSDEVLSNRIDGFDTDSERRKNVDEATEDSFEHDIDAFNALETPDTEEDDVFKDPTDDDTLAIHLDYQPIEQLCQRLGDKSWAGLKDNWQWRRFEHVDPETRPAQALLLVLMKLERLYHATPKAPNLRAQNQFLREHANMLRYYFHKVGIVVEHIRTERLDTPGHEGTGDQAGSRKRKRMTRDLVSYVIPMLAHVLVTAWGLGGKTWLQTSFTSTSLELLRRSLGWIKVLYPRLLCELKRPVEEIPGNRNQQQVWGRQDIVRENIDTLLDEVYQAIGTGLDQLAETEAGAGKRPQTHSRKVRRDEQPTIEQTATEEARQAVVAERRTRSLRSDRDIHYHDELSTTHSQQSPSLALRPVEWSIEEQRVLFLRIQASFPLCPDLENLRWELNKTLAQTVAMTEQILGKILAKVLIGYSAEEQTAQLRQIMRSHEAAQS